MTTVPCNAFYLPATQPVHNSTINFESCLFLCVLFSRLLLNFTVVCLPLPEYSLQCFCFPLFCAFLVLVLSS